MIPFGMPGPGMTTDRRRQTARWIARRDAPSSTTACTRWRPWRRAPTSRSSCSDWRAQGIASVKLFMTYEGFAVDDDLFLKVLDAARRLGCWSWCMPRTTPASAARAGACSSSAAPTCATTPSPTARSWSARRRIAHWRWPRSPARASPSSTSPRAQSCEEVTRARARGVDVLAETCPQYLFISAARSRPPARRCHPFRLFAAAARVGQPSPSLEGTRRRRHRSVVVGPFALSRSPTSSANPPRPASTPRSAAFPASRPGCRCCSPRGFWPAA